MSLPDYEPSSWTTSSNEALHISLAEPEGAFTFNPTFTYPIFGDSEQIFGYKGLRIDLAFDCRSMYPFLGVKYQSKLSEDVKDVEKTLLEFLPKETVVKDEALWLDKIEQENFELPGKPVYTYQIDGETYRIFKFKLDDSNGLKLHLRIQIFVLLFIEAGSYIDSTDNVWEIYAIYKCPEDKKESFVGFSTAYSHWKHPGTAAHDASETLELQFRKKISQFIVLPPYQSKGHGKTLYNCMVDEWLADDKVKEITVEDPSEAFDDLRDRCDLQRLNRADFLNGVKLPIEEPWIEKQVALHKMDRRQFERCVEMTLLWMLQNKKGGIENLSEKNVRLQIKKRLYLKNRDALSELEKADKMDKLQTAYERLHEDYERILEKAGLATGVKREQSHELPDAKRPRL
ncbi:hypothetical protein KL944_003625 [Ogataea haglerorum]|nr:hypothetical protein KL944_003625 [Ogataea haglerorum]